MTFKTMIAMSYSHWKLLSFQIPFSTRNLFCLWACGHQEQTCLLHTITFHTTQNVLKNTWHEYKIIFITKKKLNYITYRILNSLGNFRTEDLIGSSAPSTNIELETEIISLNFGLRYYLFKAT